MVSRSANKRSSLTTMLPTASASAGASSSTTLRWGVVKIVGMVLIAMAVAGGVFLCLRYFSRNESAEENSAITGVEKPREVKEPKEVSVEELAKELPEKVDFQPTVETWAAGAGGSRSVLIYDLKRGEVAGAYGTSESYNTASLYKLFVVYEGYRRVQRGEWDKTAMVGTTGYNILKCLDLAIRESYSPCAETLWAIIGHDELDRIIEKDFKITESKISGLLSNPGDIMKMMKTFYEHEEIIDEELVAVMKDSFLNQPVTTYDWRQGLPSGFSAGVNVYNKVGWDWNGKSWNVYHDAAIVEFPELGRHFIVIVMTNQVPYQKIRELGGMIEGVVRSTVRE